MGGVRRAPSEIDSLKWNGWTPLATGSQSIGQRGAFDLIKYKRINRLYQLIAEYSVDSGKVLISEREIMERGHVLLDLFDAAGSNQR